MPCYEIKWREVYEMKAMVVAPSYEEAVMAGADLMENTPSLDFIEDWKSDDAITCTDVDGVKVETELADKQGFVCLPMGGFAPSADDTKPSEKDEQSQVDVK